jgi:hypothetical protein
MIVHYFVAHTIAEFLMSHQAALPARDLLARQTSLPERYRPTLNYRHYTTSAPVESSARIHLQGNAYVEEPRPTYQPERYKERSYGADLTYGYP